MEDTGRPDQQEGDDRIWRTLSIFLPQMDPIPPDLVQKGQESFAWRTVDAELALLVRDSLGDPLAAQPVRRDAPRRDEDTRLLTFKAPNLIVEVELTPVGGRWQLVGQLIEPRAARIEIRHQEGSTAVEADELGMFSASRIPSGPASLRCHLSGATDAAPVVTDWFRL